MRRKHGLLLFIASCIPGCGEMYQGYMKRGISILTVFYGLLTIAIFLEVGALAVLLLPIWMFSFFDSYNLRGQTDEEAAANPDAYLFGLFDMDEEKLGRLCKKLQHHWMAAGDSGRLGTVQHCIGVAGGCLGGVLPGYVVAVSDPDL